MKSFIVFSLMCIFSANVMAKPGYLPKFKAAYPVAKSLQNCQVCHQADYSRNDYGKDYAANNHDFKAIEGFDSDVDGFNNLDEINAGFLPGNRDSHPAQ